MSKRTKTQAAPPPEVVWLYSVEEIMGLTYCIYEHATQRLLRDGNGTIHFPTAHAATEHAVRLAKRHKYEDLIRDVPWR